MARRRWRDLLHGRHFENRQRSVGRPRLCALEKDGELPLSVCSLAAETLALDVKIEREAAHFERHLVAFDLSVVEGQYLVGRALTPTAA